MSERHIREPGGELLRARGFGCGGASDQPAVDYRDKLPLEGPTAEPLGLRIADISEAQCAFLHATGPMGAGGTGPCATLGEVNESVLVRRAELCLAPRRFASGTRQRCGCCT